MEPESVERKLTAILSADVKGYGRLMGDDEEATLRTLTAPPPDSLLQGVLYSTCLLTHGLYPSHEV